MFAAMVIAIALFLATMANGIAQKENELADMYRSRAKSMQVVGMAEDVEQYYLENATFPASITALGSSQGFEHSRSQQDPWQGYVVSPAINDGYWTFNRLVLFSNDPSKGVDAASYLNSNTCGTGGYDSAQSWCGSATGEWYRRDSRDRFNEQLGTQRVHMTRLLQKLGDYYNTAGKFPDKIGGVSLVAGDINTVATLASYAGNAKNCSGTFTYMGVPIDCGDMFDLWGQPIGYQFVNNKHIVLTSETPIFNAAGTRVVIGADFDNSQI